MCQNYASSAVFSTVILDVTLLVRRSLWLGNIIRTTLSNPSGLAKERKLLGNSSMVDYPKKAKFHEVKCPQCKASLLIKFTVKVYPIKRNKAVLDFMSSVFKGLSEGAERLVEQVDKPQTAKVVKKTRRKVAATAKPKKRAPVRKKIVVPRPKKVTATEEVLQIIKRHKQGIDINELKNKTGLKDRKLRVIVARAYKQGKIKRKARGVYV